MKWKKIFALTFTGCVFSFAVASFAADDQIRNTAPTVSAGLENKSEGGIPSAVASMNKFEFEPVIEGTQVVHDFIIQNKGTEILNIEKVKTG